MTTSAPTAASPLVDLAKVRRHLELLRHGATPRALYDCACDLPGLLAEIDRLTAELARAHDERQRARQVHTLLGVEHHALLTAARVTTAAAAAGWPNPLAWLIDHLAERGQLPPAGILPQHLAAGGLYPRR